MGFGTVFATVAFMFIFASMILFTVNTQKNLTIQAQEQRLTAERERAQGASALSITAESYATDSVIDWTDTTYAQFELGASENATIQSPGTLVLIGPLYSQNGSWTSEVIDSGVAGTNYTTISWTAVLPAGTDVAFQARGGASVAALEASSFTGPDGTGSTTYTVSGSTLNDGVHDSNRYVQYRAFLTTTNSANTPQLQEINIGIQRPGGVATVTIQNTGSEKLEHASTDLYLAGERIPRNTTSRTSDLSSTSDQVLWLPGESVTYTVFRTVTTPAQISVANGAARAAGSVS